MLGTLRGAGFSIEMTAHAYALIDSYVYGFALQEAALPFDGPDTVTEVAVPMIEQFASGQYPHLVELATEHMLQPGYDFGDEFDFGLDLILDGLGEALADHRRRERSRDRDREGYFLSRRRSFSAITSVCTRRSLSNQGGGAASSSPI